ncbi:unnamed protein product, partial [Dicrocoelium dendriticum]
MRSTPGAEPRICLRTLCISSRAIGFTKSSLAGRNRRGARSSLAEGLERRFFQYSVKPGIFSSSLRKAVRHLPSITVLAASFRR